MCAILNTDRRVALILFLLLFLRTQWCYTTNVDLQKLLVDPTYPGEKQQHRPDPVFILLRRMRRVLPRLSGMTEDEVDNAINFIRARTF